MIILDIFFEQIILDEVFTLPKILSLYFKSLIFFNNSWNKLSFIINLFKLQNKSLNNSAKCGFHLSELLYKEPVKDPKLIQAIVFTLFCPPDLDGKVLLRVQVANFFPSLIWTLHRLINCSYYSHSIYYLRFKNGTQKLQCCVHSLFSYGKNDAFQGCFCT